MNVEEAFVLDNEPEFALARTTLGLTLYLAESTTWAQHGAVAALEAFLRCAPTEQLEWYTTSMVPQWQRVGSGGIRSLVGALGTSWVHTGVRHHFQFQLVDDPQVPTLGFAYREVDDSRSARCGHLQVVLPPSHSAEDLLALAIEIGHEWPVWSGVGGYLASWNAYEKAPAFCCLYRWAKRYLGLDIQDPDAMALHAREGVTGVGWLTLIGDPLIAQIGLDTSALDRSWSEGIATMALRRGLLVRAGPAPVLGDVNTLVYPAAYAEVARVLAPWLVPEPPAMWGGFAEPETTDAWFRRLVDPRPWEESAP